AHPRTAARAARHCGRGPHATADLVGEHCSVHCGRPGTDGVRPALAAQSAGRGDSDGAAPCRRSPASGALGPRAGSAANAVQARIAADQCCVLGRAGLD
nr:hypothetical protein [Tanacetum cinerariifolium]